MDYESVLRLDGSFFKGPVLMISSCLAMAALSFAMLKKVWFLEGPGSSVTQ